MLIHWAIQLYIVQLIEGKKKQLYCYYRMELIHQLKIQEVSLFNLHLPLSFSQKELLQ